MCSTCSVTFGQTACFRHISRTKTTKQVRKTLILFQTCNLIFIFKKFSRIITCIDVKMNSFYLQFSVIFFKSSARVRLKIEHSTANERANKGYTVQFFLVKRSFFSEQLIRSLSTSQSPARNFQVSWTTKTWGRQQLIGSIAGQVNKWALAHPFPTNDK